MKPTSRTKEWLIAPLDRRIGRPSQVHLRLRVPSVLFLMALSLFGTTTAVPYTQNSELESKLGQSEMQVLALLPAAGYKNGAAGFFKEHGFAVVSGTQRAWCQSHARGILPPGCYVELFFHRQGESSTDMRGEPCGYVGRWFQAEPGTAYIPTAGSPFAAAIAKSDPKVFDRDLNDPSAPRSLRQARRLEECSSKPLRQ